MTSRERFRAALNHQQSDRVPIDLGGDMHNGIHAVAYERLLRHLKEQDDIVLYDQIQHLARVKDSILRRLHVDTRYLFANAVQDGAFRRDANGCWADEWGVIRKDVGLYDENIKAPLHGAGLEAVRAYQLPDPKDAARFAGLRERAKQLYEQTEYAVIGGNAASLSYLTSELFGFEEYMERILIDREVIEAMTDRVLQWQKDFFTCYLSEIGDYVEMVWMGDDWGTQIAPLISPSLFREMFVPRYMDLIRHIKSCAEVKVALHSCGSVAWAMDDFIRCGIDVLHPVQGDAEGLQDAFDLKRRYGKDLVFYSNLKNQTVLPYGSVEDVRRDVREKMDALFCEGGYIMSGGHNVQADVPPQNLLALVDEAIGEIR